MFPLEDDAKTYIENITNITPVWYTRKLLLILKSVELYQSLSAKCLQDSFLMKSKFYKTTFSHRPISVSLVISSAYFRNTKNTDMINTFFFQLDEQWHWRTGEHTGKKVLLDEVSELLKAERSWSLYHQLHQEVHMKQATTLSNKLSYPYSVETQHALFLYLQ